MGIHDLRITLFTPASHCFREATNESWSSTTGAQITGWIPCNSWYGNYLYLVTDRRDNENSRVFLCFVHRDSRDLMAPDRSKRSRTFYVQLADSTVVTDTVADLDALPSFPSPPPLDLLDDAQWI